MIEELDGIEVHSYGTVVFPSTVSELGTPTVKNRGDTFILTADLLAELRDRNGAYPKWVEELAAPDPNAESEPLVATGPWPADKTKFIRGSLSWIHERRRRLGDALGIADVAERQQAIVQINRELGLPVPENSNSFSY